MTDKLPWYRTMVGGPHMASCLEVGRQLQSFLDGEVDGLTAARLSRHLELCRRCGMRAETYRQIKRSLERRAVDVDPDAVARLRAFGEHLLEQGDGPDDPA
ncbi:MAG: zf-HC2 domain-containing protein [Nocardioidaceae bacterium]